jgi:hypothetical protein
MKPPARLIAKVAARRHIASSHPIEPALRKRISGSIDGEASQKDMTGASGTPPVRRAAMTGFLLRTLSILFEAPERFNRTARGTERARKGRMWRKARTMKSRIQKASRATSAMVSYYIVFLR